MINPERLDVAEAGGKRWVKFQASGAHCCCWKINFCRAIVLTLRDGIVDFVPLVAFVELPRAVIFNNKESWEC